MTTPASETRVGRLRLPAAMRPAVRTLRRLVDRFTRTQVTLLAAALAYYAAFSLGPLALLLGGWLGSALRARPELSLRFREGLADLLAPLLPEGMDAHGTIEASFDAVVDQLAAGGWVRTVITLAVLLWASSGFFASLQRALESIFAVPAARGFLRTRFVAMLLVAGVAAVIAVELIGVTLAGWAWSLLDAGIRQVETLGIDLPDLGPWPTGPEPLRIALAVTAFALCFRYLPRGGAHWGGALVGAAVSVAGMQAMRLLLPLAVDEARFNVVYGVVASLVVLLFWLYFALLLFLVGALVAADISRQMRRRERLLQLRNDRRAAGR